MRLRVRLYARAFSVIERGVAAGGMCGTLLLIQHAAWLRDSPRPATAPCPANHHPNRRTCADIAKIARFLNKIVVPPQGIHRSASLPPSPQAK